jgi:hypothetical protein
MDPSVTVWLVLFLKTVTQCQLKIKTFSKSFLSHPTQWAAVRQISSLIKEQPQRPKVSTVTLPCHGNCPKMASAPPMTKGFKTTFNFPALGSVEKWLKSLEGICREGLRWTMALALGLPIDGLMFLRTSAHSLLV